MATLKAVRTEGGQFTPSDRLRVTLDNAGTLEYCVHNLEIVSGQEVTHGGGAASDIPLHYKAFERDADGDGIIDYSTVYMNVVQTVKGTSVVKVCADIITTSEFEAYKVRRSNWLAANTTIVNSLGPNTMNIEEVIYEADKGILFSNMPDNALPTIIKSGEITLIWIDDE